MFNYRLRQHLRYCVDVRGKWYKARSKYDPDRIPVTPEEVFGVVKSTLYH